MHGICYIDVAGAMASPAITTFKVGRTTMKRLFAFFASAILCAACAAPPQPDPELATSIRNVHATDLDEFWELKRKSFDISGVQPGVFDDIDCGHVVLQFVVDSNGEIWDVEVVEAVPDDRFVRPALRALAKREFVPAESNPGRVPVRVRQATTFQES
ncbi:MAG: TonB family protein, partial [Wenzhouxiangellaceae bacterium]|nr:TonB family protein [Wenzhouxiangellaceae bacterium]